MTNLVNRKIKTPLQGTRAFEQKHSENHQCTLAIFTWSSSLHHIGCKNNCIADVAYGLILQAINHECMVKQGCLHGMKSPGERLSVWVLTTCFMTFFNYFFLHQVLVCRKSRKFSISTGLITRQVGRMVRYKVMQWVFFMY